MIQFSPEELMMLEYILTPSEGTRPDSTNGQQLMYIENWKKAREENRAADEAYWRAKQEEQAALLEKKRKEDAEFWAEIFKQQEIRRAKKRAEDTAFWANVNKQRENQQPSKLRFRFL